MKKRIKLIYTLTALFSAVISAWQTPMTSKRSYRAALSQDVVKKEIENGIGTQFDPVFAKITLEMIEEDTDYKLHEA